MICEVHWVFFQRTDAKSHLVLSKSKDWCLVTVISIQELPNCKFEAVPSSYCDISRRDMHRWIINEHKHGNVLKMFSYNKIIPILAGIVPSGRILPEKGDQRIVS